MKKIFLDLLTGEPKNSQQPEIHHSENSIYDDFLNVDQAEDRILMLIHQQRFGSYSVGGILTGGLYKKMWGCTVFIDVHDTSLEAICIMIYETSG